jgi:hypothetical protein
MGQVDVKYFNRVHEPVASATADRAHYAIKTETKPTSYPGGNSLRREYTAWLLSDPTTTKRSASKKLLAEWIDQISN